MKQGMMTCGVSFPASWAERVSEFNQFTQGTPLLLPGHRPQLLVIARAQTPEGVEKELIIYALVYNLVRATMLVAAKQQEVEASRISFIDAMRWLQTARPGEPVPKLVVNPCRPDRHEPRVVKDLQDTYRKMTRPRAELRKAMKRGEFVTR